MKNELPVAKNNPAVLRTINEPTSIDMLLERAAKKQREMPRGSIEIANTWSSGKGIGGKIKAEILQLGFEAGVDTNQQLLNTTSIKIVRK